MILRRGDGLLSALSLNLPRLGSHREMKASAEKRSALKIQKQPADFVFKGGKEEEARSTIGQKRRGPKMKHLSTLGQDIEGLRNLQGLCTERLKELGVGASRAQKNKTRHFPTTPGKKAAVSGTPCKSKAVFGKPLRDLGPSSVIFDGEDIRVPHFLVAILNYLREHIETDGLFRKAGSTGRQRNLRLSIEEAETFFLSDGEKETTSPLDVGALLKLWLRELPEPLIPTRFHETFVK